MTKNGFWDNATVGRARGEQTRDGRTEYGNLDTPLSILSAATMSARSPRDERRSLFYKYQGATRTVHACGTDTIATVKLRIEERQGIPAYMQSLS